MPVIPELWEPEAGELQVWDQSEQFKDLARLFQNKNLKRAGNAAQCKYSGSISSTIK